MTASTTQFSRGDVISRKYEIEAHLGDGLYGASYRARHITSGRKLVIKFLRADLLNGENDLNSFKAAFQEAKDLRHPGLVRRLFLGILKPMQRKVCSILNRKSHQ